MSDSDTDESDEAAVSGPMQEELCQQWEYEQTLSAYKKRKYARQEETLLRGDGKSSWLPSGCTLPLKYRILESAMPPPIQALALHKFQQLALMQDPGQYSKLHHWLRTLLRLPFGVYHRPSHKSHRSKVAHLCHTQDVMDQWIYGHAEAKESILHMVSQSLTNPDGMPQIIGIQGPVGNGKTTLVRQGVARALGRPFVHISLGGASDVALLHGHAYTYENSSYGRVVSSLIDGGCMNPVLYFDELDKVSQSDKGAEVIAALIHMTDPAQNCEFRDHFFADVPLDLSKVVFIFSFNDEKLLSPVLLDRLYLIRTQSLQPQDKVVIASQFLLPTLLDNVGLPRGALTLAARGVRFLIDASPREQGVRQLRRALEHVVLRLNTMKLLRDAAQKRVKRARIARVLQGMAGCPHAAGLTQQLDFPLELEVDLLRKLVPRRPPAPPHAHMYT